MSVAIARPHYVQALPEGVRSRIIADVNGIDMHVLEAGAGMSGRPVVMLLHGFPEFAFCWRRVMPLLADLGFHVVAPDQRGYGSWDRPPVTFDDDPGDCDILNLVADMVSLVGRMDLDRVHAIVGHDFGAMVASIAALARPDLFARLGKRLARPAKDRSGPACARSWCGLRRPRPGGWHGWLQRRQ